MTAPLPDNRGLDNHGLDNHRLDRLDRLILNAVQSDFPVAARPYAVLAERLNAAHGLGLTEQEISGRLQTLRRDGFIRRLGAVFEARTLGYRSSLCAARVPDEKLDLCRDLVNQAPQVTHNYLRSGELNVWFTFTCRHPEELDEFLANLRQAAGLDEINILETENTFKIKVNFQLQDG